MKIKFIGAIFLLSFQFGTIQPSGFNWENVWPSARESSGCNFVGSVFSTASNISLEKCRYNCQFQMHYNFACTHYVWNPNEKNGTCFLKSGIASEITATSTDPTVKCGFPTIIWKLISDNFWWSFNCGFPGKLLKTEITSEGVHCGSLCRNNSNCTHFNWIQNKTCVMKSGGALKSHATLVLDVRKRGTTCGILRQPDEGPEVNTWENFWPSARESAGCDFDGGESKELNNLSVEECRYNCQFHEHDQFVCTHYVWNPNDKNGTCLLKSGIALEKTTIPSEPNVKCGFPTIIWKLILDNIWWSYNCRFSGNDLKMLRTHKGVHCGNLCRITANCTHFNWIRNQTCYMKSGGALKSDAELMFDEYRTKTTCGIVSEPDEETAVNRITTEPSITREPVEELNQATTPVAPVTDYEDCDCECPY